MEGERRRRPIGKKKTNMRRIKGLETDPGSSESSNDNESSEDQGHRKRRKQGKENTRGS